jgi:undecaprenyl-diphosphatase
VSVAHPKAKSLKPKANLWTRWTSWLTNLERHELSWLIVGLGGCVLLMVFLMLAGEVMEGDTLAFDTKIVRAFRQANDPSLPIGPAWTVTVLEDLTAMGGPTILTLVVLSIIGFLALQTRYRTALVIFITSASGEIVNYSMKAVFMRARPTIVPHLREAFSTSFPSGHAMESAIIYLTLGAMMMRIAERRVTKMYCLGMAFFLTFLVGLSRVYLGVHYPTDVLGGWIIGLFWASICWLAAQHFEAEAGIKAERKKTA